jgi:hypothetical protein
MDTEPLVREETLTMDGLRFHYRDWGDRSAWPGTIPRGARSPSPRRATG